MIPIASQFVDAALEWDKAAATVKSVFHAPPLLSGTFRATIAATVVNSAQDLWRVTVKKNGHADGFAHFGDNRDPPLSLEIKCSAKQRNPTLVAEFDKVHQVERATEILTYQTMLVAAFDPSAKLAILPRKILLLGPQSMRSLQPLLLSLIDRQSAAFLRSRKNGEKGGRDSIRVPESVLVSKATNADDVVLLLQMSGKNAYYCRQELQKDLFGDNSQDHRGRLSCRLGDHAD